MQTNIIFDDVDMWHLEQQWWANWPDSDEQIDQIVMSKLTRDDEQRLADFDDLAAGVDEQQRLRSALQQYWWECWADDQQYWQATEQIEETYELIWQ